MEFSQQDFWSGLPLPSPRDLPDPGIEPVPFASPAPTGGFFTPAPSGKPLEWIVYGNCITPWQPVMYGASQKEALFLWLGNKSPNKPSWQNQRQHSTQHTEKLINGIHYCYCSSPFVSWRQEDLKSVPCLPLTRMLLHTFSETLVLPYIKSPTLL